MDEYSSACQFFGQWGDSTASVLGRTGRGNWGVQVHAALLLNHSGSREELHEFSSLFSTYRKEFTITSLQSCCEGEVDPRTTFSLVSVTQRELG